jgi:hypothetical protein
VVFIVKMFFLFLFFCLSCHIPETLGTKMSSAVAAAIGGRVSQCLDTESPRRVTYSVTSKPSPLRGRGQRQRGTGTRAEKEARW